MTVLMLGGIAMMCLSFLAAFLRAPEWAAWGFFYPGATMFLMAFALPVFDVV